MASLGSGASQRSPTTSVHRDFAVEAFERTGAVQLGQRCAGGSSCRRGHPVLSFAEGALGLVEQPGELGSLGRN